MTNSDSKSGESTGNSSTNVTQTATSLVNSQSNSSSGKLTLAELEEKSKYDLKLLAGGLCDMGLLPLYEEELFKLKKPELQRREPLVPIATLSDVESATQKYLNRKI